MGTKASLGSHWLLGARAVRDLVETSGNISVGSDHPQSELSVTGVSCKLDCVVVQDLETKGSSEGTFVCVEADSL